MPPRNRDFELSPRTNGCQAPYALRTSGPLETHPWASGRSPGSDFQALWRQAVMSGLSWFYSFLQLTVAFSSAVLAADSALVFFHSTVATSAGRPN